MLILFGVTLSLYINNFYVLRSPTKLVDKYEIWLTNYRHEIHQTF